MRGEKKLSTQLTTKSRAACGDCCLLEAAFPQSDQTSREIFFGHGVTQHGNTQTVPMANSAKGKQCERQTVRKANSANGRPDYHTAWNHPIPEDDQPPPRTLPGQPAGPTVNLPPVATDVEYAKNQGVRLEVGFVGYAPVIGFTINPGTPSHSTTKCQTLAPPTLHLKLSFTTHRRAPLKSCGSTTPRTGVSTLSLFPACPLLPKVARLPACSRRVRCMNLMAPKDSRGGGDPVAYKCFFSRTKYG